MRHEKSAGVDRVLLKRYREEAGLSLREFCRQFEEVSGIGLRDSNLSAMEQGRRQIPDHVIEMGAPILKHRPEDFPEYRLRHMPNEVLTDPFADWLLRRLYRLPNLGENERRELLGSARLLALLEEAGPYSTEPE